jgi:TrmH family RNA methyltransferase
MQEVVGQKDPVMKLLGGLHGRASRARSGRFLAEGPELVRRALGFGAGVEHILATAAFFDSAEGGNLLDQSASAGVEVGVVSAGLLAKMLEAKPTPACLAIVKQRHTPVDQMFCAGNALILLAECIESEDNLGLLMRTAEAAGTTGVILTEGGADVFSRRAVRGSRGAIFSVPVCVNAKAGEAIDMARASGMSTIASSAHAEEGHTQADCSGSTMIIVGNEHRGISAAVRSVVEHVVSIPMHGRLSSLNVAVAAGVLLYEAARQRAGRP